MKKIANCIHHTHWDLIWYFTVQDATTQFSYNMKELLNAFDNNELKNFFLDGQTAPLDTFIELYPEEKARVSKYIREGKLVVGPFNSQPDSFISSGESIINNIRLGLKTSTELGKASKIAYLPDSFGHSVDYPKIFNQYGIQDFVITRGVGDEYGLDSEFYFQSGDKSQVLVYTMIAGYGYGIYPFKDGTLFTDKAVDYNKIDVNKLIERLMDYSTVENEFVFPIGFDQNPMIRDVQDKIEKYNKLQNKIHFIETTWVEYFNKIREKGKNIKTHKHELISTQYHRVHRSIYSARADVKGLQDKCERILTYELQPIMAMLDNLGINYGHGLLDKAWETLILCQTHSSANLTEETNDYIERETKNAFNLANSHKQYLLKLVALSLDTENSEMMPLIVMSTLPSKHDEIINAKIFTKSSEFSILYNDTKIQYTIINSTKKNNGVLRKNPIDINSDKFYFETDVIFQAKDLEGISYRTYFIKEEITAEYSIVKETTHFVENKYYKVFQDDKGITILHKQTNKVYNRVLALEDVGDEGDSFDYSYPDHDWKINDYFENAEIDYSTSPLIQTMHISGAMEIPKNLADRKEKKCNSILEYNIELILEKDSDVIKFSGSINNNSEQHRVRLVFNSSSDNEYSYAGTQYSIIKRKTFSKEEEFWRERNYFEEPSPIFPLLNHVSAVSDDKTMTIFTRSCKEYEFVNEGFKDIGITIFRSYGALGFPDLNRRPGRPSGLDYMVFKTPSCQMKGQNYFEIGLSYSPNYEPNLIFNKYVKYATNNSTYQHQPFDKSINPIDYFPTNPLKTKLPLNYRFVEIINGEGVFGTIVKSDISNSYLLRIFNSDMKKVEFGHIYSSIENNEYTITDLQESSNEKISEADEQLSTNELRIIKIS